MMSVLNKRHIEYNQAKIALDQASKSLLGADGDLEESLEDMEMDNALSKMQEVMREGAQFAELNQAEIFEIDSDAENKKEPADVEESMEAAEEDPYTTGVDASMNGAGEPKPKAMTPFRSGGSPLRVATSHLKKAKGTAWVRKRWELDIHIGVEMAIQVGSNLQTRLNPLMLRFSITLNKTSHGATILNQLRVALVEWLSMMLWNAFLMMAESLG